MENPFIFGTATYDEWFTDREDDVKRLSLNFIHGVNTIIISPRQWGKTSLVYKVSDAVKSKELKIVNIDIFSCRSEEDFYRLFAVEVIKQTSKKWEEWVQNAKQFLASLTPKFSFGADPVNDFSISLDFSNKRISEDDVLKLPQQIAALKKVKIVVCIDEFQQIAEIDNSTVFQKKLRSVWQLQKQVSYCLFGSKKHLMSELFSKQSLPFYRFGELIMLQKIERIYWIQFIQSRFAETNKYISSELADRICQTVDNHSSYVQQYAWNVWIRTEKEANETILEEALTNMIYQNSMLYHSYMENLTAMQINFLHALADGITHEFSRNEVIAKYNLNTSSNITRIRKSLEQKELIDVFPQMVSFNDPVFRIWLKRRDFKILVT